jgi:hypothetical protein
MAGANQLAAPPRIAVISTPRSGNTWIRHLVGGAYDLPVASRHELADADWAALPEALALQIHWPREPGFLDRLRAHGFRVLTVARHPLDVLISILHVAVYDVESERWLAGRGGDERGLWGAWPRSPAFLDYATGPRAAALLAVTADWWGRPDAVSVRYEDFVADPAAATRALEPHFGPLRCPSLDALLERTSLAQMARDFTNNHFWKGQPGLWRRLLPAAEARAIAEAHAAVFETLGYTCDPDPDLDPETADRNWLALFGPELGATLRRDTAAFRHQMARMDQTAQAAYEQAAAMLAERDAIRAELADRADELHEARRALGACRAALEDERRLLAVMEQERAVQVRSLGTLHAELAGTRHALTAAAAERDAARLEHDAERAAVADLRSELAEARAERDAAREAIRHLDNALRSYHGLGGFSIKVARRVQNLRDRYPGLARRLKRILRPRAA